MDLNEFDRAAALSSLVLSIPDGLTAFNDWHERGAGPRTDGPGRLPPGEWPPLREALIESGWFKQDGATLVPTASGQVFLAALGELYRGQQRDSHYGQVYDFLADAPRGAAADVGCGGGYMLSKLAQYGYSPLFAYDLHSISLGVAATKAGAIHPYAGDATTLPEIADGQLAMIFSRNALQYFHHARFAAHAARALMPGGYVVAELTGISYYLRAWHFMQIKDPRHIASTLLVWLRTLIYETTGAQYRLGAKTFEVGWTARSIRRFAGQACLRIVSMTPAPTLKGYLVIFQKQP